jgi:hypothetical protein
MGLEFSIISIGTLSSNPFWHEPPAVRTAHATTTLVRDEDRLILVDPSLPAMALVSHLFERSGLQAEAITDVFCTTLRPTHRRAIAAFDQAKWYCSEEELTSYRNHLDGLHASAHRQGGDLAAAIHTDLAILERFHPMPEKLTEQVHYYPLPGASVGSAGLLLAGATKTVLIAGDAALTADHILAGRAWSGCVDAEAATASLGEVLEIADLIVPGHDNYVVNPGR